MGGEDWSMWIDSLSGLLAPGAITVASYIGPSLTEAVYRKVLSAG
jgi:trans-2-enoyl-CoA reductase